MSNVHPLISIIVPVYNGEKYIGEALKSIRRSAVQPEIIVVDDGSTDDSINIASTFSATIVRHETNRGAPAARNTGIKASSGSFITFLDCDDLLRSESIARRLAFLTEHPKEMVVMGVVDDAIDSDGRLLGRLKEALSLPSNSEIPELLTFPFYQAKKQLGTMISTGAFLYRRELFEHIGTFDESLPGAYDLEFLLRILQRSSVTILPHSCFDYRIHDANSSFVSTPAGLRSTQRVQAERVLVYAQYKL